ncbi:hypothetical protein, partial [Acetobacterium fimetarium]|uniref:hypothetical protein n=1 Tax=Acetobacterium fimetarium TaxID=52691 RepID=UPI001A9AD591
ILDTSCILWIFTNWLVSNNLNLLEVFFIVNPLTYLNYTGSFLPTFILFSAGCCTHRTDQLLICCMLQDRTLFEMSAMMHRACPLGYNMM